MYMMNILNTIDTMNVHDAMNGFEGVRHCEEDGYEIDMRNRLNSSCRSLLVRRSFFLKGAPNHGKRYGELPKAIPCNILKYN